VAAPILFCIRFPCVIIEIVPVGFRDFRQYPLVDIVFQFIVPFVVGLAICTTGYGTDRETGAKTCFACIGKQDEIKLLDMKPGERTYLYLTQKDGEHKGVGLFSALHNKQKNVLTQFLALKKLQQKQDVMLHTNKLTSTQRTFANLLGVKFEDHGYLLEKEFFSLVQSVQVQTHVFLSESFSYATMESIILGTPCIMSLKVAKNMGISNPDVIVNDVDDSDEMASKLEKLLVREDFAAFQETIRQTGTETAERNNANLKAHLSEQIGKF